MERDCQSQGLFPRDLSPKAQNSGTVPTIFDPVPTVPSICVPWDDLGTAKFLRLLRTRVSWDGSEISEFFREHDLQNDILE